MLNLRNEKIAKKIGFLPFLLLTDRHWYLCINNIETNVKVKFGDGSVLSLCLHFLISYDGKKLFAIKLLWATHEFALFINTKMNKFSIETSCVLQYHANFIGQNSISNAVALICWSHKM